MSTINALTWTALTAAINQIKSPNSFLTKLLFPNHETLPTEDLELGVITGGREIAPFTRRGSEAILIGGTGKRFMTVSGPNVRVKQAFTPGDHLFGREPGSVVHLTGGQNQISYVEQRIARDLQYMADMMTNSVEYLVSRMLQGSISYILEDGEVITVTVPRDAANNITLSTFWDTGGANARPLANIHTVKEVMSEAEGLAPTDAILGNAAAHALQELVEAGYIKLLGMNNNSGAVSVGTATFTQQFNDDGVIFLGELGGVRFWQYGRTANLNGVATSMIRDKYAEFISVSPASDRRLYFAAIPDMDALEGRKLQSERFAKSWLEKDPSRMLALTHSRPLPWPRKPNATVSMKVVSG